MSIILQDVRYALRLLVKQRGFSAVILITLALGIGANAAIFSVVSGVLLKSLPYKDPSRLLFAWEVNAQLPSPTIPASTLNYRDWKQQNKSFQGMAARRPTTANLETGDRADRILGEQITSDYFSVLGLAPIAGRDFGSQDDAIGADPVVLLSERLWKRSFAANRNIVGQTIKLNGKSTTVVGIMPDDYRPNIEYWTPFIIDYSKADRNLHEAQVVARLAPNATIQSAQAEMDIIAAGLAKEYPDLDGGWSVHLLSMHDSIVLNIKPALLILLGAVALVLLIACANVANLLLARAASREREIAIRMALGAGRLNLIRQILVESLILSLLGGALGAGIAAWGTELLIKLNPQGIPRSAEITTDWKVLGFALAVSIVTGLLFGLFPALHISRPNLQASLKDGGRSNTAGSGVLGLRNALVVAEIALSLVLMVAAGLALKSFSKLQQVDAGFNTRGTLTFQLFLPPAEYPKPANLDQFEKEAKAKLQELPGVESVAAASAVPLATGTAQYIFWPEGHPQPTPSDAPLARYQVVSDGYFGTMGIPLIQGREFNGFDTGESQQVVIVNKQLASSMWPGEDPIGKRLTVGVPLKGEQPDWAKVVGVVGNVRQATLSGDPGMAMYQAFSQGPSPAFNFIIRTKGDPSTLAEPARSAIAALNPAMPVSNIKTMEKIVYESVAPFRFNTYLLGLFAGLALVLAAVGVFGVINYSVSQRVQEIGIRMALGATTGDVSMMIVRQALTVSTAGLVIGLGGCFAVTRLMAGILFKVSATDATTMAVVVVLLVLVSLLASYLPARRATRVDPIKALRFE